MSEAFLDPVGVELCFVQERAGRPTQIMYRERIGICPVVAYQLDGAVNDAVQSRHTYWGGRLIAAGMHV
jgi:hypothetical protein